MAIKHIVDKALKQPMSRKEFLGQVGAVFLAVIGVTSILHSLSGATQHGVGSRGGSTARTNPAGYGDMPYGGATEG